MSCPLHSNDNSCAGCAKVKIQRLEHQLAEIKQKRQGAALNEMMEWSVKELAELVLDLVDENDDLERQLAEAREVIDWLTNQRLKEKGE